MTLDELAGIAAVGTGQRSVVRTPEALALYVPGGDPTDPQAGAYTLLDAAAALAVVRRGTPPRPSVSPVEAAADDVRPEPSAQLVALLAPLLADEPGIIRTAQDRTAVLVEALGLLAAQGFRLPHRLLPTAVARGDLRPSVQPLLDARGEWLLTQLRRAGLDGEEPTDGDDVWETGTSAQRLAWFAEQRALDPDAARDLARRVWSESAAAFRTDLLRHIVATVVPGDEPFLEDCLDDRAEGVRVFAREGLARLPESGYVGRMVARARAAVAVVDGDATAMSRLLHRQARRLLLSPPRVDEAAARDGITAKLSTADRLNTLVAAVPPRLWESLTGAPVGALATLPQEEPRTDLRPGLVAGIVRHGDSEAAASLVGTGYVDANLVALLPADLLAAVVQGVPPEQLATVVTPLPLPWPAEVVTQIGSRLLSATSHQVPAEVWTLFARGVPLRLAPSWATRLRSAGEPEGRPARNVWRDAVTVLTVRALFADALRPRNDPDGGRP